MAEVLNHTRQCRLASDTEFAATVWSRFRGLMMRSPEAFGDGSALVIDPCTSIHMFFMRFPIDVLYLDRAGRVLRAQRSIKPWRIGPLYTRGARYVVELPVGVIEASGTRTGDHIVLRSSGE